MGLIAWCVRCIPGLSILALLSLIFCALGDPLQWPWWSSETYSSNGTGHRHTSGGRHPPSDFLTPSQLFFVGYTVLIHLLALGFPLRLCWAVWHINREIRSAIAQNSSSYRQSGIRPLTRTVGSPGASLSHIETTRRDSSSRSSSSSGESRSRSDSLGMVVHAILLPNYKEDIDTLRETLEVLASHAQARISYDVSVGFFASAPLDQPCALSSIVRSLTVMCFEGILGDGGERP